MRILAAAPSNSAADLLIERLSTHINKRDLLRINAVQVVKDSILIPLEEYKRCATKSYGVQLASN